MALKELTEKILDEARKEAERIIGDAEAEAIEIQKETEKSVQDLTDRAQHDLDRALNENTKRVTASAEQDAGNTIAKARREAIEETFRAAIEKLSQSSADEYAKLIAGFAKHLPKQTDHATIYVPHARSKDTKAALSKAGVKGKIEDSKEFSGGFVLVDRDAEYNFSFERIIADKKGELETAVAQILFDSEEKK